MPEPTSTLTFEDLILEVARKSRTAYAGVDGDGSLEIPQDAYDLSEAKRHVNNAIRMFIHDGPSPHGWQWVKPTASITIWGNQGATPTKTLTSGGIFSGVTTLTANVDSFYPTMELKDITITGVGTFNIASYDSATQIKVTGDATAASASTWSITADGNYTLPVTFSGQHGGVISYGANTNQGLDIAWSSEGVIRQWREDVSDETGDPYWAAVRPMTVGSPRRRWELLVYPKPDEVMTLSFPYTLGFDKLIDLDEVPPCPFSHDDTIRAACLAMVEKDVEENLGPDWAYYQKALLNSYRIDAQSTPKRLGYFGNGGGSPTNVRDFRQNFYDRPTVGFNS